MSATGPRSRPPESIVVAGGGVVVVGSSVVVVGDGVVVVGGVVEGLSDSG